MIDNWIKEMLTDIFRVMVNNPFKVSFYGKKNTINILTYSFFYFP